MDEYNKLYARLNKLQELAFFSAPPRGNSGPNSPEISPRGGEEEMRSEEEDLNEQIKEQRIRYELFVDQSKQMALVYPYLSEDVLCRVELLNAKWEILQINAITTKPLAAGQAQQQKKRFNLSDIESNIGLLDQWLSDLEEKILPLKFKLRWSEQAMNQKKSEVKIIQDEIAAHGKILKAILRSCQKQIEETSSTSSPSLSDPSSETLHSVLAQIESLEDRWHEIGLRALEWQYFLEGLQWTAEEQWEGQQRPHNSRLSDRGKPSPRRFKHQVCKRAKSFGRPTETTTTTQHWEDGGELSSSSSASVGGPRRPKWPRIEDDESTSAKTVKQATSSFRGRRASKNGSRRRTWPPTSKSSRRSSQTTSSAFPFTMADTSVPCPEVGGGVRSPSQSRKSNLSLPLKSIISTSEDTPVTDKAAPNCAAYFFEHGRGVLTCCDHDSGLENHTPDQCPNSRTTALRRPATGEDTDEDLGMDIKELVTRADELVTFPITKPVATTHTVLGIQHPSDVDASAEDEDCFGHDEMSCDEEEDDFDEEGSVDDSLASSSASSSFSHDLTITTSHSALDGLGVLGGHTSGGAMTTSMTSSMGTSMTASTSSSTGGAGAKIRRRVRTRKSSYAARRSGDFSSTASLYQPNLQSTPVKKNKSLKGSKTTLVDKRNAHSDSESSPEAAMHAMKKTTTLAVPAVGSSSAVKKQVAADISEAELSEYWDQEKYLSEHNYEEPIDEASALQILNFGDDYRTFLDSLSDGFSSASHHAVNNNNNNGDGVSSSSSHPLAGAGAAAAGGENSRRIKRRYRKFKSVTDPDGCESLSDTEVNRINEIISKLSAQLDEMSGELKFITKKIYKEDVSEYLGKVLQISQENSSVLQVITEPLNRREYDTVGLKKTARGIKGLQKNWEDLGSFSMELLNLAETFQSLQSSMAGKERAITDLVERVMAATSDDEEEQNQLLQQQQDVDNDVDEEDDDELRARQGMRKRRDYAKYAQELKAALVNLTGYKSDLFNMNLGVHNLLAAFQALKARYHKDNDEEDADESKVSDRIEGLKEAVGRLYKKWDEAFHRVNSKLVETEMLESKVRMLEEEAKLLVESLHSLRKRRTQRKTKTRSVGMAMMAANAEAANKAGGGAAKNKAPGGSDSCLFEDSGISETSSGFCTDSEIAETEQIVQRLQSLTKTLRETPLPESSSILDIVQEGLIEGGKELCLLKKKCEAETQTQSEELLHELRLGEEDTTTTDADAKTVAAAGKRHKKRSRLYRVFRIAVAVHFLLVLLAGLSWVLEPTCCDHAHARSILSFVPTLTYNNGPPPI